MSVDGYRGLFQTWCKNQVPSLFFVLEVRGKCDGWVEEGEPCPVRFVRQGARPGEIRMCFTGQR